MRFKNIQLLTEDIDAVRKQYPNISDEDFNALIEADPTYRKGSNSVGTFGKWILNQCKKGLIQNRGNGYIEDIRTHTNVAYILSEYADAIKNKEINHDINSFKTVRELYDAISEAPDKQLTDRQIQRMQKNAKDQIYKVAENDEWEIYIPLSYPGSVYLGKGTNWCTAATSAEGKRMFNSYTGVDPEQVVTKDMEPFDLYTFEDMDDEQGPLYVIISKKDPKEKYQFHFPTSSYMDAHDNPIDEVEFFVNNDFVYSELYSELEMWPTLIDEIEMASNVVNADIVYPDDAVGDLAKYVKTMTVNGNELDGYIDVREFYDFTNLERIDIEDGIHTIEADAFNSKHLTDIYLPSTMESVASDLFMFTVPHQKGTPYPTTLHIDRNSPFGQKVAKASKEFAENMYKCNIDLGQEKPMEVHEALAKLKEAFDDDDFVSKEQEFTSKETAHGNGKANGGQGRVPALFAKVKVKPGDVLLDYGCGEYTTTDRIQEYLGDDVTYLGYDKYNRTSQENSEALRTARQNGGADVATCANVLNVIKERDVRVNEVIANIYRYLKNGGTAYFDVYADKKKEGPKQTGTDKWQEFRMIDTYLDEVEEIFGEGHVKRVGTILVATK